MNETRRNVLILGGATKDTLNQESAAINTEEIRENNGWEYYDSTMDSYSESFKSVMEGERDLNNFVRNFFRERKQRPIGIELGGPAVKLFAGFDHNTFSNTAGFTLKKLPEYEHIQNHEVIEADVFLKTGDERSWNQVLGWVQKNGKPDFIIERMVGPLFMIRGLDLFFMILKRWVNILNNGGLMLIQVPPHIFRKIITKSGPGFIDKDERVVRYELGVKNITCNVDPVMDNFLVLRIEK
jgi:hypothetical protein